MLIHTHTHDTDSFTHALTHIHTLAGPVPQVGVNYRLLIQNKFQLCKKPKKPVSWPEMLPRMALAVYTAATTTITTLPP